VTFVQRLLYSVKALFFFSNEDPLRNVRVRFLRGIRMWESFWLYVKEQILTGSTGVVNLTIPVLHPRLARL
jgi:hypothetical protein